MHRVRVDQLFRERAARQYLRSEKGGSVGSLCRRAVARQLVVVTDQDKKRNAKADDPEPRTKLRKRGTVWLRGWLVLVGVATVGWLIAIAWAARVLLQWLFG